jgi:hypothetical protein
MKMINGKYLFVLFLITLFSSGCLLKSGKNGNNACDEVTVRFASAKLRTSKKVLSGFLTWYFNQNCLWFHLSDSMQNQRISLLIEEDDCTVLFHDSKCRINVKNWSDKLYLAYGYNLEFDFIQQFFRQDFADDTIQTYRFQGKAKETLEFSFRKTPESRKMLTLKHANPEFFIRLNLISTKKSNRAFDLMREKMFQIDDCPNEEIKNLKEML